MTSFRQRHSARARLAPALVALAISLVIRAPIAAAQSAIPLTIIRPDGVTRVLAPAELSTLPRLVRRADPRDSVRTFGGYDLRAVLQLAGIRTDSLRGGELRRAIRLTAADGYAVVIALSEIDPTLGGRRVLVADEENGAPLPLDARPRRVVVEGDGRPARWIRQLTTITVLDLLPPPP